VPWDIVSIGHESVAQLMTKRHPFPGCVGGAGHVVGGCAFIEAVEDAIK
jgi:hypothetical protein